MIKAILVRVQNFSKAFLKDRRGANELLATIGIIAITVGILVAVSPTMRSTVSSMITNALNSASNFFNSAIQGQ